MGEGEIKRYSKRTLLMFCSQGPEAIRALAIQIKVVEKHMSIYAYDWITNSWNMLLQTIKHSNKSQKAISDYSTVTLKPGRLTM